MKAFYFPGSTNELFGALHESGPGTASGGVVLCYPFGYEYVQFHRAFRGLAEQLARQGLPTLRFDFFGSGDSLGSTEDATIDRWIDDIRAAVAELKMRACCADVALVGYRFGATLAALALQGEYGAASAVLWDPVLDGKRYLDSLRNAHTKKLEAVGSTGEIQPRGDSEELLGYVCSAELVGQFETVEEGLFRAVSAANVLLVDTIESEALQSLGDDLRQKGVRCDYLSQPGPRVWAEDINRVVVPLPIIRKIGGWLVRQNERGSAGG